MMFSQLLKFANLYSLSGYRVFLKLDNNISYHCDITFVQLFITMLNIEGAPV